MNQTFSKVCFLDIELQRQSARTGFPALREQPFDYSFSRSTMIRLE